MTEEVATAAYESTWPRVRSAEWFQGFAAWLRARREARLERRLVRVETRFFDAYCRGGERQHETLLVDYEFVNRPAVRRILHEVAAGGSLDVAGLELEFFIAEPSGDRGAFRSNMSCFAECLGGTMRGRSARSRNWAATTRSTRSDDQDREFI